MRRIGIGRAPFLTAFAVVTSGALLLGQTGEWTDPSGHKTLFVGVAPDVTLEVLDWAGSGPPLILLSGLGNTAHVFDQFAYQFTDRFHVLGITRRGYGASTHPASGYDLATRVHDVLAVLDQRGFDEVILVGHSIAGDEMTKFAAAYPTRIRALVYIDAAYDRTQVTDLPQPPFPGPPPDTFSSVDRFTSYLARVWNWRAPEAETYNTRVVTPDGRVGEMKTAATIPAQVVKLLEPPDYTRMCAPALALYARPELRTAYPYYGDFNTESRMRAERVVAATRGYQQQAISEFRKGSKSRRVEILDGNHYLFFTNEAEVVRLIRSFLTEVLQ